jgi:hypothetical protein
LADVHAGIDERLRRAIDVGRRNELQRLPAGVRSR